MEKMNPNKCRIDLIMFDGVSYMVKPGSDLCSFFPHATIIHVADHVLALFCHDVLELPPIKAIIQKYKFLHQTFGTGARHSVYTA